MPQIITITFSPCIDRSTSVRSLIPERKLQCAIPRLEPGGGGINVARAIKKLGGEATAVYPAGGYTGKFFNKLLAEEGIPAIIIETKNETRENVIVLDEMTNQQYRFGMPASRLLETEWKQILQLIEEIRDVEFIVASGSLPSGVPPDLFAHLALIIKKKKIKFIVDTSGEALKYAADEGVYLLKPNLGELSFLVNKDYLEDDEIAIAARQIIQKGKCEVLIVSMGAMGAMLVTKDLHRTFPCPRVKKKSTVGAGDSMVAGIVLSLASGKSLEYATQYGVACGTAATMNPGTQLCKKRDADRLIAAVAANELLFDSGYHLL